MWLPHQSSALALSVPSEAARILLQTLDHADGSVAARRRLSDTMTSTVAVLGRRVSGTNGSGGGSSGSSGGSSVSSGDSKGKLDGSC